MKKEDYIVDEWVIWSNDEEIFYILVASIESERVNYSEYIHVNEKKHCVGNCSYPIDYSAIKGLAAISEVKKYLPSNHPHHNKNKIEQVNSVDDLEPLIKLLKKIRK